MDAFECCKHGGGLGRRKRARSLPPATRRATAMPWLATAAALLRSTLLQAVLIEERLQTLALNFTPRSALARLRCCRLPPLRRRQRKGAGWSRGMAAPLGLAPAPLQTMARGEVVWR